MAYIRVGPDQEHVTINLALAEAAFGDIILVDPGNYDENVHITKPGISFVANVTDPYQREVVVKEIRAWFLTSSTKHTIVIEGFTIGNSGNPTTAAVYHAGSQSCTNMTLIYSRCVFWAEYDPVSAFQVLPMYINSNIDCNFQFINCTHQQSLLDLGTNYYDTLVNGNERCVLSWVRHIIMLRQATYEWYDASNVPVASITVYRNFTYSEDMIGYGVKYGANIIDIPKKYYFLGISIILAPYLTP